MLQTLKASFTKNMDADTNNPRSSAPKAVYIEHVTHPERDNHFRATAASSKFLKANQKNIRLECTQCQTKLEKLLKCAKVMLKYLNTVAAVHRVSPTAFSVRASGTAQKRWDFRLG
jgi:hypothetical protein